MQKYQPEFIEVTQIKAIIKACIPFFEEQAGRYYLNSIFPKDGDMRGLIGVSCGLRTLQRLMAEGLNSIEETGSLERAINSHRDRKHDIELYQKGLLTNDKCILQSLYEKGLTNWDLDWGYTFDEEMALALFEAWQQSLGTVPAQKPVEKGSFAVKLIPNSIRKIANEGLIQETEEGSHIFINQKGSLQELKNSLRARGLDIPRNRDIESFIWHIENGEARQYDSSTIRKAFPKT